jgi:hypothetical protein
MYKRKNKSGLPPEWRRERSWAEMTGFIKMLPDFKNIEHLFTGIEEIIPYALYRLVEKISFLRIIIAGNAEEIEYGEKQIKILRRSIKLAQGFNDKDTVLEREEEIKKWEKAISVFKKINENELIEYMYQLLPRLFAFKTNSLRDKFFVETIAIIYGKSLKNLCGWEDITTSRVLYYYEWLDGKKVYHTSKKGMSYEPRQIKESCPFLDFENGVAKCSVGICNNSARAEKYRIRSSRFDEKKKKEIEDSLEALSFPLK